MYVPAAKRKYTKEIKVFYEQLDYLDKNFKIIQVTTYITGDFNVKLEQGRRSERDNKY